MKTIAALFVAAALVACGGGGGGEPTGPKPVATVSINSVGLTVTLGGTLQLSAIARDASGNTLVGKTIMWSSNNTAVATVGSDGLVQTVAVGTAYIVAVSDGKRDSVLVNVQPSNPANAPQINSISAPVLVPGATVTLTGIRFGIGAGANVVRINGVLVTIVSATATEIVITIPLTGFPCSATHNAIITVTANGETGTRTYPLAVAVQRALTIGQSFTLLPGAADLSCNELANGGRFMISGFNASTQRSATIAYQLVTAAGSAVAAATPEPAQVIAGTSPSGRLGARDFAGDFRRDEMWRRGRAHREINELSREAVRRVGSPKKYFKAARESQSPAPGAAYLSARPAVLAETTLVRIPSINASGFCNKFTEVSTRTVFVGSKVIIKEDVANPLFNQMDGLYQQLGEEFDRDMAPILAANFGNILALDASLDNNGRIVMIFSKAVNDLGRVAGFVVSCDFYPRSVFQSSNFGETFYAIVPTNAASGFASGTRDSWYRSIRSVVMHEAKHITSFAEKISRSSPDNPAFEEAWLEEGTAMHAEELWARPIYGIALRGNATYRPTIYCDVRPPDRFPECAGRPYVMIDHFAYNYRYLENVETLSPLGKATDDDATFYGSAWSLVRWAIDHYATTDAALLRPLTLEVGVTGVANLSARTGRPWPEMLADWTLASAVDDYPSFTPARAQLALLSWNTRDIYDSMDRDLVGFDKPFPLVPRTLAPSGTQDVPSVSGGTAAFFDLDVPASAKTLLNLKGAGGGAIPSTLGMAVVRVQ